MNQKITNKSAMLRHELPGKIAIPATLLFFMLLLCIVSWLSYENSKQIDKAFQRTVEVDARKLNLIDKMLQIIQNRRLIINEIIMWSDPYEKSHETLIPLFHNTLEKFNKMPLTKEESRYAQQIKMLFEKSEGIQKNVLENGLSGNSEQAKANLLDEFMPVVKKLFNQLQELRDKQFLFSKSAYSNSRNTIEKNNVILWSTVIIAMLLGGLIALGVLKQVKNAFNKYYNKLTLIYEELQTSNHSLKAENKKRKIAEKQIKRQNDELEIRVQNRTRELEEINLTLGDKNQQLEVSMTQLQKTQQQLVQAEKMASLGNLVAGVAHEINTPLGVSITAGSHVQDEISELQKQVTAGIFKKSQVKKFLSIADESINILLSNLNKAAELVNSFKQVANDQSNEQQRTFNVTDYLNEILLSINSEIKKSQVKVAIDCPTSLEITSYPGVFSQIITSLVLNSLTHAFINTQNRAIRIKIQVDKKNITIYCHDNGNGIKKENLKKIFDPFYTTARNEGYNGLGLHIIYNLIHQKLHGAIHCKSEINKGTLFEIKFNEA